jgi:chemotaxis protein CheX
MTLNGVRTSAIATGQPRGTTQTESGMGTSLKESMHLVSDPKHLDESVEEVFQMMLGAQCQRETDAEAAGAVPASGSVTAVIGFGGLLSGACVFRCETEAAMKIAALMTGMEFSEVDDTVKDGIGEICNMVAGAWKGKVPGLAAGCGLSVPAVITGNDYKLRVQAPQFQLEHRYGMGDEYFTVTIVCDGIQ